MYQHRVQYYETDKMGITHHSNYIRWMEEARIAFLAEIGWPFERLEAMGILSPVVSVDCKYKVTSTFADVISIRVVVEEFKGVKLKLSYRMTKENDQVCCEAHSEHCFLNAQGRPIRMQKEYPELYQALVSLVGKEE